MGLEDVLKNLIIALYQPLIFFIPENRIPDDILVKFNSKERKSVFNKVLLLNSKGQFFETIEKVELLQILYKPNDLENNIIRLMDQESLLDTKRFKTLLEKYITHVRFYVFVSKWMVENISSMVFPDEDITWYMEFQKSAFDKHKKELERQFNLMITSSLTSEEVLIYLENKTFNEKVSQSSVDAIKTSAKKNSIPNDELNKPVLITDEEARKFLLETVFNYKIK